METTQSSERIQSSPEVTVITKWMKPNEIRKAGLNRDGRSWEEADRYDRLERRESMLLDLYDIRPLTAAESEELKAIQRELWDMDEAVRARKKPVTFAAATAA